MNNTTVTSASGVRRAAWDLGVPGLVIAMGEATFSPRIWSITHVQSGACVMWFENPELAAKVLTADLAPLTDWDRPGEDIQAEPGLQNKVYDVLHASGGNMACELGKWQP